MSKEYGNWVTGVWICPGCNHEIFPRALEMAGAPMPIKCPKCKEKNEVVLMEYNEEG